MSNAPSNLNDYANNMFRFERLSEAWIDSCAAYLIRVFGDLRGKSVIDYAFGRGNWSLAFIRAGVARVVAIDAALDNVRRFSDYCRTHAIGNVEVIHGDVMESPIEREADLLWIYGILPCIADQDTFLERIRPMAAGADAQFLVYAYDAGGLRQFVVDTCRRGAVYRSEQEFADDSQVLTRAARMRARDDLTAPVVNWHTLEGLSALLTRHGLYPVTQPASFAEFQGASTSEEFRPHHLVCRLSAHRPAELREAPRPYSKDLAVLWVLADAVYEPASADAHRRIALGLFNTHFSSLGADGAAGPVLTEDFLFLFHLLMRRGVAPGDLKEPAASLYALAVKSMSDEPRGLVSSSGSFLEGYLVSNRIRI